MHKLVSQYIAQVFSLKNHGLSPDHKTPSGVEVEMAEMSGMQGDEEKSETRDLGTTVKDPSLSTSTLTA